MEEKEIMEARQIINSYIASNFDLRAHSMFDEDLIEENVVHYGLSRSIGLEKPPFPHHHKNTRHHKEKIKPELEEKNKKIRALNFLRLFQPLNKLFLTEQREGSQSERGLIEVSETGSKIDLTDLLRQSS